MIRNEQALALQLADSRGLFVKRDEATPASLSVY